MIDFIRSKRIQFHFISVSCFDRNNVVDSCLNHTKCKHIHMHTKPEYVFNQMSAISVQTNFSAIISHVRKSTHSLICSIKLRVKRHTDQKMSTTYGH